MGPYPGSVRDPSGAVLEIPEGWALLPAGDAGLTRRVKRAGPTWTLKARRGRRVISLGLWADADIIARERATLVEERADPAYARKLEAGRRRRAREQARYVQEFGAAVFEFLSFAPRYEELGRALASAIVEQAAAVGSGTVARTQRISVERRAEAATIAWLRHQTTAYDELAIPRVKGMRREVRRLLAQRSRRLLDRYRRGEPIAPERCPLRVGLARAPGPRVDEDGDFELEI